jgi:hypothetical protein
MPILKRDLRRCLIQKFGFEEVPGSRHEAVSLIVEGRKVATTRFSRSGRDIDDSLLTLMARQIRVNLSTLKQMHSCTVGLDEYLAHLERGGHLNRP